MAKIQFTYARPIALIALIALAACSGGERGARGGAAWLTEKVHPRNLQLTLDTAAMEARIVTPKGATISAVGEDGTYYTLTIPKGALARDTRIKLIPVRAISGLPFGGAAPAVQLKPDGLRLLRPATLTIEPVKPIALAEQVAFAYAGAGEDAHLYPTRGDSTRVQFDLLHFSGYGFGKAPPGDPGVEMLQKAADQEARLSARAAWLIRVLKRQAEAAGEEPAFDRILPQIETLFIEYYDTVLRPLMQVAETDDRMAACAIQRFLMWERQLALLGMADDESEAPAAASKGQGQGGTTGGQELARRSAEGWASLNTIWENAARNAMPRADKACREQHDFSAYNRVIGIEREAQLTGRSQSQGSTVFAEVMEHLEACLTFEVELVSVIENKTRTGRSTFHVAATLPATLAFDDKKDESAPLRYVDFKASGRPMEELFGKYQKSADGEDFVRQGIRGMAELGNSEMSAAGTRNGTLRVLGLRYEPDTVDVAATGCSGEDTKEKASVDSTWRVVLEIDAPTELTRFTPLHIGKAFTSEMHEWMRFFRQFRDKDLIYAPGASDADREDGGTQQMAIQVKQTAPGTWRAEFSTPDRGAAPGYSLTENGHLVLRHTPRNP